MAGLWGNLSVCACKWSGHSSVSGCLCAGFLALERPGKEPAAVLPLPQEPQQFDDFFFFFNETSIQTSKQKGEKNGFVYIPMRRKNDGNKRSLIKNKSQMDSAFLLPRLQVYLRSRWVLGRELKLIHTQMGSLNTEGKRKLF